MPTTDGPTLRLSQTRPRPTEAPTEYRVGLEYWDSTIRLGQVDATVNFVMLPQEREDLRWYLEDYLQYPYDPAPLKAARVEEWLGTVGRDLFTALIEGSRDTNRLWARIADQLNDTRVEVVTEVREAAAIPWELLRDPLTDTPLALNAGEFVRGQRNQATPAHLPQGGGPIRILLVICRPGLGEDVPFRSVAKKLVEPLGTRDDFQLDVLRPATFEQLGRVLRQAKAAGHRSPPADSHRRRRCTRGISCGDRAPALVPSAGHVARSRPCRTRRGSVRPGAA